MCAGINPKTSSPSSTTTTAFAQEQYGFLSGRDLSDWEEVCCAPPTIKSPASPHDDQRKQPLEEQKSYMYNIKTGSMIPSDYMPRILPEPQHIDGYDPE